MGKKLVSGGLEPTWVSPSSTACVPMGPMHCTPLFLTVLGPQQKWTGGIDIPSHIDRYMCMCIHIYITVNLKGNQSWIFIGRIDAEAETLILWPQWEELTHWKTPWCWERLKAGGEGDNRGWDGRMASPTQWTWVWASSGSWWWTGKPDVLQSIRSQRVEHDWATELNSHIYLPLALTHGVFPISHTNPPK